tara:strand:- start:267 stop:476 length:210 start_codon:yes stop_codon:yes gene_type:complete
MSDPGSATAGQPASEISPTLKPLYIGSKKELSSSFKVNLLTKLVFNLLWILEGDIFFINFLPDFSFSKR